MHFRGFISTADYIKCEMTRDLSREMKRDLKREMEREMERGENAVTDPHFGEFLERELSIGFLLGCTEIAEVAEHICQSQGAP